MKNSWKGYPAPFGGVWAQAVLWFLVRDAGSEASLPLSWEGASRVSDGPSGGSLPTCISFVSFRLVKILISYGADVNLRNGSGKDRRVRARPWALNAEARAVPIAAGAGRRAPPGRGGRARVNACAPRPCAWQLSLLRWQAGRGPRAEPVGALSPAPLPCVAA